MGIVRVDGHLLRKMIIAGANKLAENKEQIDALNVFPVPDGDTGTNMSLTALAAAREVEKLDTGDIYAVAKAASSGSLRGARGNSGVILSQLFRGFAKGLESLREAGVDDIAVAFESSVQTAYKAVMKPKEGTILTVAREMAETAATNAFDADDIEQLMREVLLSGEEILKKTTDMLPALKQAGVVDAGGKGLLTLLYGGFNSISAGEVEMIRTGSSTETKVDFSALASVAHEEIIFGYCTEFFINVGQTTDAIEDELKIYLETIGDSLVVVGDEDIIKIHVHTDNPGLALEKALTFGNLSNLKIENMRLQHTSATGLTSENAVIHDTHKNAEPAERKELGFVSVSAGAGFKELFGSLGVDYIIEGGQTMNPSAEDIVEAVNKVNADNIIILPNNSNIILAAKQAVYLCEDKNILVVDSKSIPQGITALVSYYPGEDANANYERMQSVLGTVKTGQITYAVRDTVIDDKQIKEGDFLCILDGKIEFVYQTLFEAAKNLLDYMIEDGSEVVSIFYGAETDEHQAVTVSDYITEHYPDCELDIKSGGQPIYYYIFSVE